jgi:hypothetical protein
VSPRKEYFDALNESAHHVIACVLAPELERRGASIDPAAGTLGAPVLTHHHTDGHARLEAIAHLAGPAAVRLGGRTPDVDDHVDVEAARAILHDLGEDDREDVYHSEARGLVRAHFLTIRALALQLMQVPVLDPTETGLIVAVAEGRTPRSALEAYRRGAEV